MKRIVSLVLAISMVLSMFVTSLAATRTFDDVVDTDYAGSVEALVELGVIDGLPDGTFGPQKEVTRAQLAKMLVICLGLGDSAESLAGKTVFTDVTDSHWASGYINAAVQSKVIAGYPDGTFKPEKNVSYAEAVTMVIRALGYGNVVEKEGTWPTSYMLKAIELKLLDDMVNSPKSSEAATRGNTAILLWNMLRTPMWRIQSESEGDGMTSYATDDMIEVKFPDYLYLEDAYLVNVTINDDEVTAYVSGDEGKQTAYIDGLDLSKLVEGMRVSTLVRDYKDKEEATFLTMTPVYSFVEGFVTDMDEKEIEINDDAEYKLPAGSLPNDFKVGSYVLMEVDGNKVTSYDDVANVKVLPTKGTELKTENAVTSKISNEDALVILDGEWATRDDLEVGAVITEMTEFDGDSYYMATTERESGEFEGYVVKDAKHYLKIDGEQYRIVDGEFDAYDGEDNDDEVLPSELKVKEKENDYLGQEAEMVLNYLGQIITLYFGELDEKTAGNIYAVTSNGIYTEPGSTGLTYYINLNGEQYAFESAELPEELSGDLGINANKVYSAAKENEIVFAWVEFEGEEIDVFEIVKDGGFYGDDDKYAAEAFTGDLDKYNYLNNVAESKVSSSTSVYTATPVMNADETVVKDIEVEITEGTEAVEGVEGGLVVYDTTKSSRAKYVLVTDEAKSKDLHFGIVTDETSDDTSVDYASIDDELLEVDDDCQFAFVKGNVVGYTMNDEVIFGKVSLTPEMLDAEADIVKAVYDTEIVFSDNTKIVADKEEDDYEDYQFVEVGTRVVDNEVEFVSVEVVAEGIMDEDDLAVSFKKGDRVIFNDANQVVFIVKELPYAEVYVNGLLDSEAERTEDSDVPAEDEEEPAVKFTVTYEFSGDAPAAATVPSGDEVESGDSVTFPTVEAVDGYTFQGWTVSGDAATGIDAVTANTTVVGTWVAIEYNVTYAGDGVTTADANTYNVGDEVTVLGLNENHASGDDFLGWSYSGETYVSGDTFTMPAAHVELVATFSGDAQ